MIARSITACALPKGPDRRSKIADSRTEALEHDVAAARSLAAPAKR